MILTEVVTETLSSLGESVSKSIRFFLETDYGIEMTNIPQRAKDFDAAITLLLGPGAAYLEDAILTQLGAAIGRDGSMSPYGQKLSFQELVERAAEYYRSNEKNQ